MSDEKEIEDLIVKYGGTIESHYAADYYELWMSDLEDYTRAILADRERSAGEWLQAVLNECMRIEGCFKESDPVGTLSCLIDWHVRNAAAPLANELSDEEIERIVRETWQSDLPFSKNIIPAIRAVLAAGGRR